MMKITITFQFDSEQQTSVISSALLPEIKNRFSQIKADLTQNKETLTLTIHAEQTTTLRAACNSYLRWIQTALSINKSI